MDDLRRGVILAEIADRVARARVDLEVAAELATLDPRLVERPELRSGLLEVSGSLRALQESLVARVGVAKGG